MKIGILLGRFQPFHLGHLLLMLRILKENDYLFICIGSAQIAEPFTFDERENRIIKQFSTMKVRNFQIFPFVDPVPIEKWPEELANLIGVQSCNQYFFYRSDKLSVKYVDRLSKLGIQSNRIKRRKFYYTGPDGIIYKVRSATQIKEIHRRLGILLKGERNEQCN